MKNGIDISCLRQEEKTAIYLKSLFRSYGYREYKLTGFEDYSLYADNKSFFDGRGVLSFSVGGRLLALRPDVTLSVVKNVSSSGGTKKLFYDERVYRKAACGGEFSELRQIGVEVIGTIDGITETEVCALSLKTLEAVGAGKYILDVSHAGIIEKVLNATRLTGEDRKAAISCLESKNAHDFCDLANRCGIDKSIATAYNALIELPSIPSLALERLSQVNNIVDVDCELDELKNIVSSCGGSMNINFSIGGDFDYYNGIVFKGYVEGVPYAVLSGGRYDRLLGKFGKTEKAIGFALYLGELCEYITDAPAYPDILVLYDERTAKAAYKKAEELRKSGLKVILSREVSDFGGKVLSFKEGKYD